VPALRGYNQGGVIVTVYAPTDHTSITVHPENGGCGEEHKAGLLEEGELFRINCPACEPFILKMRTGWSATPEGVALTPDEIGEVEHAERDAKRQQNRTWGDPRLIGDAIAKAFGMGGGQVPAAMVESPSLLAQIAALAPEERAALAGMLLASGGGTVAVGSGESAQLSIEPTTQPVDDESEPAPVAATLDAPDVPPSTPVDNPVDAPAGPVRRGPGRPRRI
jgi:hypothetical protein